jgi:hypothetical protein
VFYLGLLDDGNYPISMRTMLRNKVKIAIAESGPA